MKTRIKKLRQEKNYTQELLAIKAGINQTTLSRIECGITIPDADLIVRLAGIFQVSTDYILCQSDQRLPPGQGMEKDAINAQWFQTQLALLQKLNPHQRVHLQHFLESIEGIY